jgi:AcrR family transcriptional regulator
MLWNLNRKLLKISLMRTKNPIKRKKLLSAIKKIIGDKAYHNSTIAEIAKDAGIGDATIY